MLGILLTTLTSSFHVGFRSSTNNGTLITFAHEIQKNLTCALKFPVNCLQKNIYYKSNTVIVSIIDPKPSTST